MRLLLAVKEQELQPALTAFLCANGFSVDQCDNGAAVRDYLDSFEYDAVIIWAELKDIDGCELVRLLREEEDLTPIMLLGPDTGWEERVRGLSLGADDYLNWPCALEELLARLRVQIRRRVGRATNIFTCADLVVDCNTRQVWREGREIDLTNREFAILECLVCHKGLVLTRAQIEDHVWASGYDGGSNVVDVYISYLRRKVDAPYAVKLIGTVRGKGYMLKEYKEKSEEIKENR